MIRTKHFVVAMFLLTTALLGGVFVYTPKQYPEYAHAALIFATQPATYSVASHTEVLQNIRDAFIQKVKNSYVPEAAIEVEQTPVLVETPEVVSAPEESIPAAEISEIPPNASSTGEVAPVYGNTDI
jgi:hypothetical protein